MARRPQSAFVGGASPARRPAISTEIDKRGRGLRRLPVDQDAAMDLRIVRVLLDDNSLQTLTRPFFERLPSLTALSASSNELTEVPDLLLRELLTLGLSHNAIAAVPQPRFGRELCDRFPQLQALDLSQIRLPSPGAQPISVH